MTRPPAAPPPIRRKSWPASAQYGLSSRRYFRFAGKFAQAKVARQFSHEPLFFAFHPTARCRARVIVPAKMQDAVNDVSDQLLLPRHAKPVRLDHRLIHTNKNLACQWATWLTVIKRDHVRGTCVAQARLVDARHLHLPDQLNG